MFLQVSVILFTGGISQHALQVVSQHALQWGWYPSMLCRWFPSIPCSGGWYPSMHCRWYPSMPCSRGCAIPACLAAGGCLVPGGACSQGVPVLGVRSQGVWRPPRSRRLLLRTVRILLECILVHNGVLVYFTHLAD